jgi:proliferating cell nuclear antigen
MEELCDSYSRETIGDARMFRATLDSTKTWKQIVDALATLLTEVHFVVADSGLKLRQMDSSKTAMIDLDLPSKIFQHYECDGEHDICLRMDELSKVSKRMSGDDNLEFELNDQQFEIRMTGQADRIFTLQLLSPPDDRSKKPALDLDIKAEMFTDTFKQAVKDIGVFSSQIRITATKSSLVFTGEGDTGTAQVALKPGGDDSSLYVLNAKKESSAMYALNYLSEITKAMASDSMTLQFSSDKPILIEFGLADAGRISFLLAPRVERR